MSKRARVGKAKTTSPHVATLQRQIREARQTQPLEMQVLFSFFKSVRELIRVLNEIIDLGDVRRSKVIGSGGHGGGEEDGTESVGTEESRFAKVTMQGGLDTERFRNMVAWADDRVRNVTREIRREMEAAEPRPPIPRLKSRRCRRERCAMVDRRQHGQWDNELKRFVCQSCKQPLPEGNPQ